MEDRLEDIKEKIRLKEGIHPDQQDLLFNGINWMDLDDTVKDKFIKNGDILFLVLRNRGG